MYFNKLFFLLVLSSCALLRTHDLRTEKIDNLLDSIKTTGEGRGRMSLDQRQLVFGIDAVLKDNNDWILAADFPLHGEEVLILKDLKSSNIPPADSELKQRVNTSLKNYLIKNKKSPHLADHFFNELHFVIQFIHSNRLGLKRTCKQEKEAYYICFIHSREFKVEVKDEAITISRPLPAGFRLKIIGENLTASNFKRLNIYLLSEKQSPLIALELFWK